MPAQSPPAPSEDLLFSSPANPATGASTHASSSSSGMSDERNADSVLFKLDTIAQANAAQQAQPRKPSPVARLAASAPASGGSGLIDIKKLAGSVNATPAASSSSPAPVVAPPRASEGSGLIDIKKLAAAEASSSSHGGSSPSVSNAALLSSSMLGVIPTPEGTAPPARRQTPSRTPLIVLSVLALLALAAAITAIILRG